jgi:hypothetical protein
MKVMETAAVAAGQWQTSMQTLEILRAWRKILRGERPSLAIEITRECPLRCPGCYAYEAAHLGGGVTLRELNDRKGQALIDGVLDVVDRLKPTAVIRFRLASDNTFEFRPIQAFQDRETFSPFDDQSLRTQRERLLDHTCEKEMAPSGLEP